jgi:beta-glucosidase
MMNKKFTFYTAILFSAMSFMACNTNEKEENQTNEQSTENMKFVPPVSEETALKRADSIVSLMTLNEKLDLIKGHKGFFIKGFKKYGIPDIYLTDATQGVHIRKGWQGANLEDYALPKSVAFPNALELAATWNPDLAYKYAKSIAEECRAAGIGVLLGPGLNIYRQSQNGRNFEYFGEDPYLAGKMVEQYVLGVQNTGVIATLKHFIANNTDYKRRASNSVVGERALHEIYAPAFKYGIDAGAMAVMTAYNQVNGEWAGQSEYVINDLLRGQLGFDNLVMTDWWSVTDVKALVRSGQDLEMPGGESMTKLKNYIENGEVDIKHIDRMCTSIIKTITQMGYLDHPIKDEKYLEKFDEHEQVALQTAREGIVLLRNEDDILPVAENTDKNILITGMYVDQNIFGGGSGQVEGYNTVTIIDALSKVYPNLRHKPQASDADIKNADIVIVSVGTFDWEGCDRHFAISPEQEELVLKASELNPNTIVIVNSGSGIRMTDWNDVKAIVYNWYPGQTGNTALAEILTGKTNPSGKLPMTIEKEFKDSPAYGYLPEDAKFQCDDEGYLDPNTPDSVINRWSYDISIQNAPKHLYDVKYDEGILVGYRWYDTKKIDPLFWFGHGLSYTSFKINNVEADKTSYTQNDAIKLTLEVSNTGDRDGTEVIQIYAHDNKASVMRPEKELTAFKKISLKAGETKRITIEFPASNMAFYDVNKDAWNLEAGKYKILAGNASNNIAETAEINVKE